MVLMAKTLGASPIDTNGRLGAVRGRPPHAVEHNYIRPPVVVEIGNGDRARVHGEKVSVPAPRPPVGTAPEHGKEAPPRCAICEVRHENRVRITVMVEVGHDHPAGPQGGNGKRLRAALAVRNRDACGFNDKHTVMGGVEDQIEIAVSIKIVTVHRLDGAGPRDIQIGGLP